MPIFQTYLSFKAIVYACYIYPSERTALRGIFEVIETVSNLFNCRRGSDVKELFCEVIAWWFSEKDVGLIRDSPDQDFKYLYKFYLLNPVPIIRVPIQETREEGNS